MKVSVSVLSSYDNLEEAVKKVNETSADFLHVDVMDGKFVKNEKFPINVVNKIKKMSTKKLDVHLMVKDEITVRNYAETKPDYLTFHLEIIKDSDLIKYVKSLGVKVGIAINPETKVEGLIPYIKDIDLILFMSVNPGKGGQTFKKSVLDKIKKVKKVLPKKTIVSIDGGVNGETIELCKQAGCDMVVSGSYVTNASSYEESIKKLR